MIAWAAILFIHQQNPAMDLSQLQDLFIKDRAAAQAIVRRHVSTSDLAKGAPPRIQGRYALFAIQGGPGERSAAVLSGSKELLKLQELDGKVFAAVKRFEEGDAYLVEYQLDGKVVGNRHQLEVYEPSPYVRLPDGGRKGELRDLGELKSTTYANTTRKWYVYLPPKLDPATEYPVLIATDAQWDREWMANGLENCAREGLIPPTVGIMIEPGQDRPGHYSNRSVEYDALSPRYSQFLLEEIIPQVEKIVKLSRDPTRRALIGMSSGGICSFTGCWERPDTFGCAISFIGSFTNIASGATQREGGHNYPFLIRKNEKKSIRVFLQDGENDLDNIHGNWWLANLQMESALRFKGYDYRWVPGKGFHNTKHAQKVFHQALQFWIGR